MTLRRGPANGYDAIPSKDLYRRQVWNKLASLADVNTSHALLMPSIEGTEIRVALDRGWSEDRLHVVDDNPAIVATLKRRFPRINTYGVALRDACLRIAKSGVKLGAANLDLTTCLGDHIEEMFGYLGNLPGDPYDETGRGAFATEAVIAITLLKGRERRDYFESLIQFRTDADVEEWLSGWLTRLATMRCGETPTDFVRLATAIMWLGRAFRIVRLGSYESGTQRMLWAVADTIQITAYWEKWRGLPRRVFLTDAERTRLLQMEDFRDLAAVHLTGIYGLKKRSEMAEYMKGRQRPEPTPEELAAQEDRMSNLIWKRKDIRQ